MLQLRATGHARMVSGVQDVCLQPTVTALNWARSFSRSSSKAHRRSGLYSKNRGRASLVKRLYGVNQLKFLLALCHVFSFTVHFKCFTRKSSW